MTLVGLLPPLCDNGSMLVDGGYSEFSYHWCYKGLLSMLFLVDNLPVRPLLRRFVHCLTIL